MQEQHGLAALAQVVLHAAVAAIGIAFAYQVQSAYRCIAVIKDLHRAHLRSSAAMAFKCAAQALIWPSWSWWS
jgi:hypothetical protein